MTSPDMHAEIFRLEKPLTLRIGGSTDHQTDEQGQQWVLNYCRALSQEIAQFPGSVPWKWWAQCQQLDKQNAQVEMVDLLHFLISLTQVLGMTLAAFYAACAKKHRFS